MMISPEMLLRKKPESPLAKAARLRRQNYKKVTLARKGNRKKIKWRGSLARKIVRRRPGEKIMPEEKKYLIDQCSEDFQCVKGGGCLMIASADGSTDTLNCDQCSFVMAIDKAREVVAQFKNSRPTTDAEKFFLAMAKSLCFLVSFFNEGDMENGINRAHCLATRRDILLETFCDRCSVCPTA